MLMKEREIWKEDKSDSGTDLEPSPLKFCIRGENLTSRLLEDTKEEEEAFETPQV